MDILPLSFIGSTTSLPFSIVLPCATQGIMFAVCSASVINTTGESLCHSATMLRPCVAPYVNTMLSALQFSNSATCCLDLSMSSDTS